MALYQNGILISGANTLPQMTLAEYQALPVSERPTYWERTDLNYNNIPASDVAYGSGSVEDALDDLSGDLTNISSDVTSLLTMINFQSSIKKITVGQSGTTFNIFIYTTNLQQAFYLLSFSATDINYYTWDGSSWVLLWRK